MLELDVSVTEDGKVVVVHDTTVDGKTKREGGIEDPAPDQAPRRRLLVRAPPRRPPRPPSSPQGLSLPGNRHRQAAPPEGLRALRLPGAHARAGAQGVPPDTDQCRDQGPYSARADLRVREECRGPRAVTRRREAAAAHRVPELLERRPRARRRLCVAELVLGRRSRRSGHLAQPRGDAWTASLPRARARSGGFWPGPSARRAAISAARPDTTRWCARLPWRARAPPRSADSGRRERGGG
jgi:hypothetical protein